MFEYPPVLDEDTFPAITPTEKEEPESSEGSESPEEPEERTTVAPLVGNPEERGTLALAKTGNYGVSRVLLISGDHASSPLNEGQETPDPLDPEPFCVAPGIDVLELGWNLPNVGEVKTLTLELFCAGKTEAIATKVIEASTDKNPLTANGDGFHKVTGTAVWTEDFFTFTTPEDFPDGVPTVVHSPYQLRATVEKNEGSQLPGYPLIAWTNFHVKVDSIQIEWGEEAHLPTTNNGATDGHDATFCEREKAVLAELKKNDDPCSEDELKIALDALMVSIKTNVIHDDMKAAWGDGVRIPLLAKVLVRQANGEAKPDAKALGGAKLVWDWSAPPEEGWARWLGKDPAVATDDWKKGCTAADRAYFKKVLDDAEVDEGSAPAGSRNCPAALGGKQNYKAADAGKPVFPELDGTGSMPFKVTALEGRPWAVVSEFGADDQANTTGVLFSPSRIPGDVYRVRAYLALPDTATDREGKLVLDRADKDFGEPELPLHERVEAVEGSKLPYATTSLFRVYRRAEVHYFAFPASLPSTYKTDTQAYYEQAAGLILDFKDLPALPGSFRDTARYKAAFEDALKVQTTLTTTTGGVKTDKSFQLAMRLGFLDPDTEYDPADARDFVQVRDRAAYEEAIKTAFNDNAIVVAELSEPLSPGNPELMVSGAVAGWVVGKADFGKEHTYYLMSKGGHVWAKDQSLTHESYTYSDGNVTRNQGGDKTATIKAVLTEASGWLERVTRVSMGNEQSEVKVTAGAESYTINYSKKLFSKHPSTDLSKSTKSELKDMLKRAVNAHGGGTFKVEIRGLMTTERDQRRVANVRSEVDSLFEHGPLLDTREAFAAFRRCDTSFLVGGDYPYALNGAAEFVWDRLRKKWQTDDLGGQEGIYYLALERTSKASPNPGGASFTDTNTATLGAAYSVNPGRHQQPLQKYVEPTPLMIHELGHALYLQHAPGRLLGVKSPAGGPDMEWHLPHSSCGMNYDPDPSTTGLCAFCLLNLRCWNVKSMKRYAHLVADTSAIDEDAALTKAIEYLDEDISLSDAPCWLKLSKALLQTKVSDMGAAARAVDADANNAGYAYQQWPKRPRLKELCLDGDFSKGLKPKLKKAEKKEGAQLLIDYEAEKKTCELNKIGVLREAKQIRAKCKDLAQLAEEAAEEYKAGDARFRDPLGIVMLRALCLTHFQYGDVDRGRHYFKLLSENATHSDDLGRLVYKQEEGQVVLDHKDDSPASWAEYLAHTNSHEYKITLELGDLGDVFPDGAEGTKAKLQAMGLMSRPLKHTQAGKAWTFCEDYAKDLGLDTGPKIDDALKNYLVEGGVLPPRGDLAKIRVNGGYTVQNSQTAMMLLFPEEDYPESAGYQNGEHAEEKPYSSYMLGAERYQVETAFHEDNPALGKIPLVAKVERRVKGEDDGAWKSVPKGVRVYFQLAKPDDLPDAEEVDADTARYDLAGGASYYNQVTPPALAAAPADLIKAKVLEFDPSDPSDPQAENAHFMLGGKRDLMPGGNVSEKQFEAVDNVFCGTRQQGFKGLEPEGTGERRDHAVCIETDAQGHAKVCFAPSRIGGDRYKLKVYVGPPTSTDPHPLTLETGTLVVWRTVRVSRYVRMEPSTSTAELPAYLTGDGTPDNVADLCKALPEVDLKGAIATELARSYCELILDPKAQAPEPISTYGPDILNYAKGMEAEYKTLNRPSLSKNVSIFKEPLLPKPGDTTDTIFETVLSSHHVDKKTLTVRPKGGGVDSAIAKDVDGSGTLGELKGDVASATVSYTTGKVQVTFSAAQTGKSFDVAYYPSKFLDLDALLTWPAKSPFLLNLHLPSDYNAQISPGTRPMKADGKPAHAFSYIDDRKMGLCKGWLTQAIVRGMENNGGFYPGLVVIQAHAIDNYSTIWPSGKQEGKGVENGILLFGSEEGAKWNGLCVHEISHGLFLPHAPQASGFVAHLHDADDTCVMSYDANDGDHCGHCVASLRGMAVAREPFVKAE